MSTGPFQSKLNPYYDLIRRWRATNPPTPYARIAAVLKKEHGLKITRTAIHHFLKVRACGTPSLAQNGGTNPKRRNLTKVPVEVQARVNALRGKASTREESPPSFLPPDGRLTYKRKS